MLNRLAAAIGLMLALLACPAPPARAQFSDQATWARTSTGSSPNYAITVPNYSRHLPGVQIRFMPNFDPVAASSVVINGMPGVALRKQTDINGGIAPLSGGEFKAGQMLSIAYDGTFYQIMSIGMAIGSTVSKTAAYTALNTDCGKRLALGGSTFYALTFGTPSAYGTLCTITVENTDTTRGKGIVAAGLASFTLCPGQVTTLLGSGADWRRSPSTQRCQSDPTFYFGISGSNDPALSDGLAPGTGAFLTVNRALEVIKTEYLANSAVIQADGCTGGGVIFDQLVSVVGSYANTHAIVIQGNGASPELCGILSSVSGVTVVDIQDTAGVIVDGFTIGFQAGSGTAVNCRQLVICDISNIRFASNVSGTQISGTDLASVNVTGEIRLAGNAQALLGSNHGSSTTLGSLTINLLTAVNNVLWFAASDRGGITTNGVPVSFAGNTSGAGGVRWVCETNSVISMGAITWPGTTTAGITQSGCQAP